MLRVVLQQQQSVVLRVLRMIFDDVVGRKEKRARTRPTSGYRSSATLLVSLLCPAHEWVTQESSNTARNLQPTATSNFSKPIIHRRHEPIGFPMITIRLRRLCVPAQLSYCCPLLHLHLCLAMMLCLLFLCVSPFFYPYHSCCSLSKIDEYATYVLGQVIHHTLRK